MKYRSFFRKGLVLLLIVCACKGIKGQDTLLVTIQKAEQLFSDNNLQLLAAKYNIGIAEAQVMQARLYNNPSVQVSTALYNQDRKKILDISNSTGQYGISAQQLITLAGKRNKQIKLAEINTRQSENSFFDLLRTLKYTLRSDFFNAYFLQRSIDAFNTQINAVKSLDNAYNALQEKGQASLKDAVRIRALLYALQAEQTNLQNQLRDVQSDLQLLLQTDAYIIPQYDSGRTPVSISNFPLQSLIDTAYVYRYDLKQAANALEYNQQNYALQKALRIPDVTLGAEFDKRGSYINNASFLNAAVDLPFFNRNQGNIKAAKISIVQSEVVLKFQQFTIENEVQRSYAKILNMQKMLQSFDPGFRAQFEYLMKGVTENFTKKNISLIDFTDFVESYRNNILQLDQLENDQRQAIESLNFSVGKSVIE